MAAGDLNASPGRVPACSRKCVLHRRLTCISIAIMKPSGYSAFVALSIQAARATDCCRELGQFIPHAVNFPASSQYNATGASYWSLQESDLKPACIVRPATAQDVSTAIEIIKSVPHCKFAIKGQGHSPAQGFANIDGGVTLDLTSLASIETTSDHSVAKVGAGASWLSVYRHLDPLGVGVAGGRNGNVGVGGLLLGGGISHFTTRVGWACDNVVNFELVVADGSIVNANRTSHPSLFRALKGGANNFGIVTRFDLATFPQGNISSTSLVHDISQREAVFSAFAEIADSGSFDPYVSLVMGLLYNSTSGRWLMSTSAVYTKPVLNPPVFSNLLSIPSLSNSSAMTSLSTLADEAPTPPLNWLFATATFKASTSLLADIFEVLNGTLYSFHPQGGVVWDVALEPLAGAMLSRSENKGDNVLGVRAGDNGFILLLSALWPDSSSRQTIQSKAMEAISRVETFAKSKNQLLKFQYINYAAPHQTPLQSYGPDNLEFLRKVRAAYDPEGVFQNLARGGFKLR
ncbi:hypothetical protein JDV02_001152 [Purpureocillium takamizusanense]|uniref:FAD-binding PCMH-type domain-containing protein n=1 Tax=Purpureocillium takamizusanense TaxID=2060973 RepID=A0A9Q8Q8K4_9HYPO|nr:uncharacterized protein JDV02_001152 [Purpureocillium takamizusanense]UNI14534.1 hypothetical protein JDV02_001152 [Purpureocillium takamizusanense]